MVKKHTYQELEEKIKQLEKTLAEKENHEQKMRLNEKRLQSLWKTMTMVTSDFKNICDTLLEEIVTMTESQYGFYGFISKDEKEMTLYSWSKAVMDDCDIHTKPIKFQIEQSGIWGNAVRERKPVLYNDYTLALKNKKGMPH